MAPLNSTGSLRFSQIEEEFGESIGKKFGGYRISQTIGDMTEIPLDEGIGQEKDNGTSNSIRFSQFRGKRLNVVVHYANDETRAIGGHNKYRNDSDSVTAISPDLTIDPQIKAPNGRGAKVILHVSRTLLSNKNADKIVDPDNTGQHRCALRTGNPEKWDESAILHINIGPNAVVSGAGGDGGAGGDPDSNFGRGGDGEDGSSAIGISTPVERIIIQEGAVVQAGGGGGGGGAGVKSDKAKLSGPSGGGGSGLPAGGAAAPPVVTADGAVLDFKMRWSSRFLNKSGGVYSIPATPGSAGNSPDGAFMPGTVGYREATMNWNSGSSPILDDNVSMVNNNGNPGTFQVKIRYSPHQIPGEGGQITGFQIRWSGTFVDNTGSSPVKDTSGGNPTGSGTGAWFDWANNSNNNYGLRDGIMNWSNDLSSITETVTMIGGNGDNFEVNITYEPYIPVPGTSNFTTKIIVNSIVNSGKDYSQNDVLTTSTWNNSEPGENPAPRIIQVTGVTAADYHTKVEIVEVKNTGKDYSQNDVLSTTKWNNTATNGGVSANPRILQVTEVSTAGSGNSGGVASDLGKEAGDGGNGSAIDTGDGGGVASGGGGGGGSPYGGGFLGQGGTRGIKPEDNAEDGKDGSAGKGGDGGFSDAEGSEQIDREDGAVGGTGGNNGYAIITKNVPLPTIEGNFIGRAFEGDSEIVI